MTQQLNENQEQVFLEEQFRNVFFSKRPDPKRSRLQLDPNANKKKLRKNSLTNRTVALPNVKTAAASSKAAATIATKAPKFIRRFRSRSLPIISYRQSQLSGASPLGLPSGLPNGLVSASTVHAVSSTGFAKQSANLNKSVNSISHSSNGSSGNAATAVVGNNPNTHSHIHNTQTLSHSHNHTQGHGSGHGHGHGQPPLLPPINLQSLKEIDLHEILKNPQLRHDILFDPQLQFRPNLDGERGKRKKNIIDNYWGEIEKECHNIFVMKNFNLKNSRIPSLFITLRDILLSLLPYKDRNNVNDIMDMDLLVQQLSIGTFDFVSLANWMGKIFKCHCAPMRDNWVTEMVNKFTQANNENSVEKLVCGLRMIFSILEAMKLDVANHQIRILRPVLIETAVEFEKDYFSQLIGHHKLDIADLLKWYKRGYLKKLEVMKTIFPNEIDNNVTKEHFNRNFLISSILELLSCRKMVNEFPLTLAFDHTRLILLRADIRQLVCIQLCVVLYKQLIFNNSGKLTAQEKSKALLPETINKIQEEILSIVTDDNGTIKWTRNVNAILLQLVKNSYGATNLNQGMIDFSYSWLIKQIQPNLEVYGLMEEKIFKELLIEISGNLRSGNESASASNTNSTGSINSTGNNKNISNISIPTIVSGKKLPISTKNATTGAATRSTSEMANISTRIATLVKFHWNVFGSYYIEYLNN